jgi:branched-chain amino acid transport system substrate-binding protein
VDRRAAVALGLVAGLAFAGCAEDDGDGAAESGTIKIGAVLDLTGPGAALAEPQKTTLEMLAEELNTAGGIDGRKVELVIKDDGSTEDGAAQAANALVSEDDVAILLGATRTGPSLAMRPIADAADVPMISLAASAAIVDGDDADCTFKTAQNDSVVVAKMMEYAASQGWTSVSLLRDASAFGEGVDGLVEEAGADAGVGLAAEEEFEPDATEFTAQVVNLRKADADANIIWGIAPASGLAQKSYRDLGVDAPVIHSQGSASAAYLDAAGEAAEGALVTVGKLVVADQLPPDDPQADVISEFVAEYGEATGGQRPSPFAGYAYDAWHLAVDALEAEGTDPDAVCEHLEGVSDFVGVSGVFTMTADDHSGLSTDAIRVARVEQGGFRLVADE